MPVRRRDVHNLGTQGKEMSARFFSADDKIKCLIREIGLRKLVYPGLIQQGSMTVEKAQWEIDCMEAILQQLKTAAGRSE